MGYETLSYGQTIVMQPADLQETCKRIVNNEHKFIL